MKRTFELSEAQANELQEIIPTISIKSKNGRFFLKLGTSALETVIKEVKNTHDHNNLRLLLEKS